MVVSSLVARRDLLHAEPESRTRRVHRLQRTVKPAPGAALSPGTGLRKVTVGPLTS